MPQRPSPKAKPPSRHAGEFPPHLSSGYLVRDAHRAFQRLLERRIAPFGVTRGQLQGALIGEGAVLGIVGSFLGVILGMLIAAAILRFLTGDLGNGQLHAIGASLRAAPLPMLAFFSMGTVVTGIGAWLPARTAALQPPARSLKGGDGNFVVVARTSAYSGIALLVASTNHLPKESTLMILAHVILTALLLIAYLAIFRARSKT